VLRITVEIWPGGDKTRARAVAIANVANVSDLADVSDYAVSLTEGHNPISNTPPWSQPGQQKKLGNQSNDRWSGGAERPVGPAATVVRVREMPLRRRGTNEPDARMGNEH
jgi:hypothetical protein